VSGRRRPTTPIEGQAPRPLSNSRQGRRIRFRQFANLSLTAAWASMKRLQSMEIRDALPRRRCKFNPKKSC